MRALFIAIGIDESGGRVNVSGGDVRWIEIAKRWKKMGVDVHVLTQGAGERLCKHMGLDAKIHVVPIGSNISLQDYAQRAVRPMEVPSQLKGFDGIVYSTTELWYDVFPGAKIKKAGRNARLVVVAHHVTPWRRPEVSVLNSSLFFLNQRAGFLLSRVYADRVLAVSEPTREDVVSKIGINPARVSEVSCGVDYWGINHAGNSGSSNYSAAFMGRLAKEKGVYDLIDIWEEVVKSLPNATLALIGSGKQTSVERVQSEIKRRGLEKNVDLLGQIYDFDKKFSILRSSKLFLLPSYSENWGIVIGEAMAAGLPVVCYDLKKIRSVWEDYVAWVPLGDKKAYSSKVIELLNNEEERKALTRRGLAFITRYDWENVAKQELEAITT